MVELIVVGVIVAILYFWYVSIIGKRNKVLEALAGIDVQLNKRFDLIPNILKIAKNFMEHEKSVFEEITALREKVSAPYDKAQKSEINEHLDVAELLQSKMSGLMVQVENYPDLKSDTAMINAQNSYNEVEEQIAAARRFYNSAVSDLRDSIQIFPGNIIASIAGVSDMPFIEVEPASKAPINASDYLK